jgi:hypothetical protein
MYVIWYQHTVASRLLSTEEGSEREEGAQFYGTNPPKVNLAVVMSCPLGISNVCDMVSAYGCQSSSDYRRGKRGKCPVQWHRPPGEILAAVISCTLRIRSIRCATNKQLSAFCCPRMKEERKVSSSMALTNQMRFLPQW